MLSHTSVIKLDSFPIKEIFLFILLYVIDNIQSKFIVSDIYILSVANDMATKYKTDIKLLIFNRLMSVNKIKLCFSIQFKYVLFYCFTTKRCTSVLPFWSVMDNV